MPTYDYICRNGECNTKYSETCSISEYNPEPTCEACGAIMTRDYAAPAVTFKGTGFYSSDNYEL